MFGKRLRLARRKAGLSMNALAARVTPKVTAQAISKYESGKMMPSSAVLIGLGKALGVSLDFLMGGQVEQLVDIEFRRRSGTSARDHAMAEAIVIERLEQYLAIEEILGIEHQDDAFAGLRCDRIENEDEIEARAEEVRSAWNLGLDPIPSMCALLEDKGLKVIEDDLPERISGLAFHVRRSSERPDVEAVVVSSRSNVERKRFTLCHELAHRVILSTGNPAIRLEAAMNRFAGAFLVPREHLMRESGGRRHRLTYNEIIRLKLTYGVSAAAMLMRLGQVGILRKPAVQRAFATFARSWRKNEPEPIPENHGFAAFETPFRFERLVWRALGEELISPIRAAQFLQQPLNAVEERIRGPLPP